MALKAYRLLVAKAYFDKGLGLSSLLKYAVAVFAIKIPNNSWAIISGIVYAIFCYVIGRFWYTHRYVDTENEIQNAFNPFQREMREHIKKRKI